MGLEIRIQRHNGSSHGLLLEDQLTVGRSPDNDLVIPIDKVSWKHAVIWVVHGRVLIKDLNSRNGTQLDGRPLTETTVWPSGQTVRIADVELTLVCRDAMPPRQETRGMALEDVRTGVRYPLRRPHVVIGDSETADLRIPSAEEPPVVLMCHPDGEVWLGRGDQDEPLSEGQIFCVGDTELRLVPSHDSWMPTAAEELETHPYTVEVAFDPDRGPRARFVDTVGGAAHTVTAANRVSLVYFLAKAASEDRHMPSSDFGWRSDGETRVAVWGKSGRNEDTGRLKALLHNVRAELRAAGLDPWCIEKRRGYVRLRVRKVQLH
ncbi:MAG: FHA domain-containing protein [Myxococcales bacterium]|nr:FHA domain-containing protein [Myxococcales bacterium]